MNPYGAICGGALVESASWDRIGPAGIHPFRGGQQSVAPSEIRDDLLCASARRHHRAAARTGSTKFPTVVDGAVA